MRSTSICCLTGLLLFAGMQSSRAATLNRSLIITIVEEEMSEQIHEQIIVNSGARSHSFQVYTLGPENGAVIAGAVNELLNQNNGINLQFVYLLTIGSSRFYQEVVGYESGIFARKVHWCTDDLPVPRDGWHMASFREDSLSSIIRDFDRHYTWNFELAETKEKCAVDTLGKQKPFWLGYSLGPTSQQSGRAEDYVVDAFLKHRFYASWNLGDHWNLDVDLDIGRNIPNVSAIIENEIRDELDFGALLSGDDIEVEINTVIRGHLLFGVSASMSYQFRPERPFRPYIRAGLGLDALTSFEFEVDTVLVINVDAMQSGGEGIDGYAVPPPLSSLMLPAGVGFELDLSSRWRLDSEISARLSMRGLGNDGQYSHSFQWMTGLCYRFGFRKAKTYYHYIDPDRF